MVNNPQGREIDRQLSSGEIKADFAVTSEGSHQICFANQEESINNFVFNMKTGEYTQERNQEVTKQHLLPVESQAIKVNEMIKHLRLELSDLVKSEVTLSD